MNDKEAFGANILDALCRRLAGQARTLPLPRLKELILKRGSNKTQHIKLLDRIKSLRPGVSLQVITAS